MVKLRERMVLEMMKELFPPLNKSGSADAFYKVADSILSLPSLVEIIKDAERWREYQKSLCPIGSGGMTNKTDEGEGGEG